MVGYLDDAYYPSLITILGGLFPFVSFVRIIGDYLLSIISVDYLLSIVSVDMYYFHE